MSILTTKEIEQLRPWMKQTVTSILGFEDATPAIAAAKCLEKQMSKHDIQATLEDLMPGNAATFVDKLFTEIASAKAAKKAAAVASAFVSSASDAQKRKRDDDEQISDKKRAKSEKGDKGDSDKKDDKKRDSHREKEKEKDRDRDRDHKDRDKEKEKEKDRDRDHKDRDKERHRNRSREREKEKDRDREKDRDKDREKDREREREREKEREREREKDREREREREKEREREREREKERDKEKSRDKGGDKDKDKDRHSSTSSSTPAVKTDLLAQLAASKAALKQKLEEQKKKKQQLELKDQKDVKTDKTLPPPLLLDAQGREIDAEGKLLPTSSRVALSTIKANKTFILETESKAVPDLTKSKYFDPRVPLPRVGRRKREFHFVTEGKYTKKAEKMRLKALQAELENQGPTSELEQKATGDIVSPMDVDFNPNLISIGGTAGSPLDIDEIKPEIQEQQQDEVQQIPKKEREPIPDIEWWDALILRNGKYPDGEISDPNSEFVQPELWLYIEHPVPIPPPPSVEPTVAPVLPQMLTKEERKKLHKRNRAEMVKDKRERVLLGIDPPPPPKVRIANLMRVLMNEAVQDPTLVEKQVREQMEQRQKNHDDRNEARKLTKEERNAKKKKKILEDAARELHCAVFRVRDLSHTLLRSKIDKNAQDRLLSGCVVLNSDMNLAIVEGGVKSLRKYKKLMMERIKWGEEMEPERNPSEDIPRPKNPDLPNKCDLVWEGAVAKANFKHFVFETCLNEASARKFLMDHHVGHFWDLAKSYSDPLEV